MRAALTTFFLSLMLMSAANGWAQDDATPPSEGILTTEGVEEAGDTNVDATGTADETGSVHVHNKICPVSGEEIGSMGEGATREYKGKIYTFCCPMCFTDFDQDPEKYVAIVEEMMAKEAAQGGGSDEQVTEPAVK